MDDFRMAIIDGTGPFFDSSYATAMQHSFCHQMSLQIGARALYQRGPSNDGFSDAFKMRKATDWLKAQHQQYPSAKMMAAGYSRGGSVAIAVAEQLDMAKIPVDALFLFDAVARDVLVYGRTIPANVRIARYARRSQDQTFVDKYEVKVIDEYGNETSSPLTSNPTRPFFGNTGTTFKGSVDFQSKTFLGSHGALGGVGWANVPEDAPAQVEVASWMTRQLQQQGVSVTLISNPPTAT